MFYLFYNVLVYGAQLRISLLLVTTIFIVIFIITIIIASYCILKIILIFLIFNCFVDFCLQGE